MLCADTSGPFPLLTFRPVTLYVELSMSQKLIAFGSSRFRLLSVVVTYMKPTHRLEQRIKRSHGIAVGGLASHVATKGLRERPARHRSESRRPQQPTDHQKNDTPWSSYCHCNNNQQKHSIDTKLVATASTPDSAANSFSAAVARSSRLFCTAQT